MAYRLQYDPANQTTIDIDNGTGIFLPYAQRSLLPVWDVANCMGLQLAHNDYQLVFARTNFADILLSIDGGISFAAPVSYAALIAWAKQYLFIGAVSSGSGATVSLPAVVTVGAVTGQGSNTPVITAAAYTAGFIIGGIQTISPLFRAGVGTGTLVTLLISDLGNQKPPLEIYFFKNIPTGPYNDFTAFPQINLLDLPKWTQKVSVAASDYISGGGAAYAKIDVKSELIGTQATGQIYFVAVTSGTPHPLSVSDLTFILGVYKD